MAREAEIGRERQRTRQNRNQRLAEEVKLTKKYDEKRSQQGRNNHL
jgi:hypothetical protein